MQAGFLVHDDIIDGSPMRRGRTSWGLLQQEEGHGLIGINDGLHLYMSVQQLLMSALTNPQHPRCIEIMKIFGDCANSTCFGQALDILGDLRLNSPDSSVVPPSNISKNDKDRLKDVSVSRFASIAKWKTSHYSFVLPVIAGMLLVSLFFVSSLSGFAFWTCALLFQANVKNEMLISNAKSILLEIGEYFQAQVNYFLLSLFDTFDIYMAILDCNGLSWVHFYLKSQYFLLGWLLGCLRWRRSYRKSWHGYCWWKMQLGYFHSSGKSFRRPTEHSQCKYYLLFHLTNMLRCDLYYLVDVLWG